jgi:ABC-type sugar transport system permease subunit
VFDNPRYLTTVINTLLLVGIGVNVKMFLAFLLSGFFMRRSRWIKALLVLYMLPWALPALPAFLSLHWMFIGYGGFMNSALETLFGVDVDSIHTGSRWERTFSHTSGSGCRSGPWCSWRAGGVPRTWAPPWTAPPASAASRL